MQKNNAFLIAICIATLSYAEETTVKVSYEQFNFTHSKKKDKGKRAGLHITHKEDKNLYEFKYEKTDTDTFKPPLQKDLKVDKYYFKYTYQLDTKQVFSLNYITIQDNIMKETDGGAVYGLGYHYDNFDIKQYITDYKHFNVYQSDLHYSIKETYGAWKFHAKFLGKYIHLQNAKSNNFSKNAKKDYYTLGVKLHTHYEDYHFGVGAFFGKRLFAVLNNGFKVQHHAMEFNKSYMCGLGKHYSWGEINLKYVYQEATEIPIDNKHVKVKNIIFSLGYHF